MTDPLSSTPQQINPPDLVNLLNELKKDVFANLNCVNVGTIESFDASNQTASVQIALKAVKDIASDGTRTVVERPLLLECPVMVLSGGSSHLTLPVAVGDTCIVLFNDREIDNWFISGGIQTPSSFRKHDIADGIAIVGIRNIQNAIDDYLVDGVRLRYDAASQIDLTTALIESTAALFKHNGDAQITGDLQADQDVTIDENLLVKGGTTFLGLVEGDGSSEINIDADIIQVAGREMHVGNGATGTFDTVTVVDGIVISGSP